MGGGRGEGSHATQAHMAICIGPLHRYGPTQRPAKPTSSPTLRRAPYLWVWQLSGMHALLSQTKGRTQPMILTWGRVQSGERGGRPVPCPAAAACCRIAQLPLVLEAGVKGGHVVVPLGLEKVHTDGEAQVVRLDKLGQLPVVAALATARLYARRRVSERAGVRRGAERTAPVTHESLGMCGSASALIGASCLYSANT